MMIGFWKRLDAGRRWRVGMGVVAIVLGSVGAGVWLMNEEKQVLFAGLRAEDASAVAAELERLKVPYAVSEAGGEGDVAILVDGAEVHRTRLKVMGRELPLHGAVGLELFSNSDFGMTEFAQRVNYQRALQGELTRTILALSEVRDARVLLALPEQGLFRKASSKATASVTLRLREGRTLLGAQVLGIQRLVSAAVAGIAVGDVTVVDQTGRTLSRVSEEAEGGAGEAQLVLKREVEEYLSRKAEEVLSRVLGTRQVLASVDVTLNMDRIQTTTEDVLAGGGGRGGGGVVVRERESTRQASSPLGGSGGADGNGSALGGERAQREVEYAVGRRVASVTGQPGSIRRLHVVAVVTQDVDGRRREELRKTVAASVGADAERGDTVVVQSIQPGVMSGGGKESEEVGGGDAGVAVALAQSGPFVEGGEEVSGGPADEWRATLERQKGSMGLWGGGGALAIGLLGVWVIWYGRGSKRRVALQLSDAERQAALKQVRNWLAHGDAKRATGGGK